MSRDADSRTNEEACPREGPMKENPKKKPLAEERGHETKRFPVYVNAKVKRSTCIETSKLGQRKSANNV